MNTLGHTRREFVASSVVGATVVAARSVRSAPPREPKHKYIDIHTHLGTFYYGKELTADELVRMMDQHGVERACVLPLVSPESSPYPQTTESAIAAHKRFPDRLVPFCCVDPRCSTMPPLRPGHVVGTKGIIDILKRYQDAGCRGLGEHKTGLPFDHPQLMLLYEACNELGLPILFHLDDIRNPDTPGLPRLERVLKTFPDLPLIGHAAGFWASISGDATIADFGRYPEVPTPIAPGGALDRLMARYANLYGDLSEPGGERAIARDRAFGRDFIMRRADQLLFGTDFLMPGQQVAQFDLFDSLNLPDEVQYKVYRGNALRLLKLRERSNP
jgi:predicted TIM-barrel fold metal-dependent hydrolase